MSNLKNFVSAADNDRVGDIIYLASVTIPHGYLLCNGSAVSREIYSELFEVIGEQFGAGDGSTTFNIPDLRGRFLKCVSAVEEPGVHNGQTFQDHSHSYSSSFTLYWTTSGTSTYYLTTNPDASLGQIIATEGAARPTNINLNFCIRAW